VLIGFLLISLIAILTVVSFAHMGYAAYKVFALSKDPQKYGRITRDILLLLTSRSLAGAERAQWCQKAVRG